MMDRFYILFHHLQQENEHKLTTFIDTLNGKDKDITRLVYA